MNGQRRHKYARLFDTAAGNVKTWDELTERQKQIAQAMFDAEWSKLLYGSCVYEIGRDGSIIARRPRTDME